MKKILAILCLTVFALPVNAKANFSYSPAENNTLQSAPVVAYMPSSAKNHTVINGYAAKEGEETPYELNAQPNATGTGTSEAVLAQLGIDESQIVDYVPGKKYESSVQKNTTETSDMLLRVAAGLALGILGCAVDPYLVTIDNQEYIFIKDNNDGKWNHKDVFGIKDSKDNLFSSLKEINPNAPIILGEELKNNNIRLVKLNKQGAMEIFDKTQDFDIEKVAYIDVSSFRPSSQNNGRTGEFGIFDIYIYNDDGTTRLVEGKVTFENIRTLQRMFKNK